MVSSKWLENLNNFGENMINSKSIIFLIGSIITQCFFVIIDYFVHSKFFGTLSSINVALGVPFLLFIYLNFLILKLNKKQNIMIILMISIILSIFSTCIGLWLGVGFFGE
jgi:hypothetical protein